MSLLILDTLISHMKYSFDVALVSMLHVVVIILVLFSIKSSLNVVGSNFCGRGQGREYMPWKFIGPPSSGGPLSF